MAVELSPKRGVERIEDGEETPSAVDHGPWMLSRDPSQPFGRFGRFGKRKWDGMDCRAEMAIREVKDFQKDPLDVWHPLDVWQHVCKSLIAQ